MARARGHYANFRYEEAYAAFEQALAQRGNGSDEITDIYLHLGIIAASMDRQQAAVDHFLRLLIVKPDAKLAKGLSPKVDAPFQKALGQSAKHLTFRLIHTPVSSLPAAGGLEVEAQLRPDSLDMATGLTLRYRVAGSSSFVALRKEGGGRHFFVVSTVEIPPGSEVDYYIEVNDQYGGVLSEFASARAPVRARATPGEQPSIVARDEVDAVEAEAEEPADEPLYAQPWFLITAGATAAVLVAGGVTTAVVLATAPSGEGAAFGQVSQEVGQAH